MKPATTMCFQFLLYILSDNKQIIWGFLFGWLHKGKPPSRSTWKELWWHIFSYGSHFMGRMIILLININHLAIIRCPHFLENWLDDYNVFFFTYLFLGENQSLNKRPGFNYKNVINGV